MKPGRSNAYVTAGLVGRCHYLVTLAELENLSAADARDLEGVCETIRRTCEEGADRARKLVPGEPPERAMFFLVRDDGGGSFRLHRIEPNGAEVDVNANYQASWPEDLDDPARLQAAFLGLFRPPTSVDDLCPALRSVAFAFDRVAELAELSALVSPRMEVGLLIRERGGVRQAHLAAPAKNVRQGSDDDVFELLSWGLPGTGTRSG